MPPETERMWRCTVCGKWSHAKRRPRHHQRFIRNGSDPEHPDWSAENIAADLELLHDDEEPLAVVEPTYPANPDEDGDPGGVWVACGPFEEWRATRVEQQ